MPCLLHFQFVSWGLPKFLLVLHAGASQGKQPGLWLISPWANLVYFLTLWEHSSLLNDQSLENLSFKHFLRFLVVSVEGIPYFGWKSKLPLVFCGHFTTILFSKIFISIYLVGCVTLFAALRSFSYVYGILVNTCEL